MSISQIFFLFFSYPKEHTYPIKFSKAITNVVAMSHM